MSIQLRDSNPPRKIPKEIYHQLISGRVLLTAIFLYFFESFSWETPQFRCLILLPIDGHSQRVNLAFSGSVNWVVVPL